MIQKADGKIIKELKTLLGMEVKLAQMLLDDGETMIQADPDFEVGAAVVVVTADEQMIPMPPNAEGQPYVLEDGREVTVVEDGVIATIGEPKAEGEEEVAPVEEEVAAATGSTDKPLTPKSIIDVVSRETKFSNEQVQELITLNETLQAEIVELKKVSEVEEVEEVEEVVELAKPIVHNPEAAVRPRGTAYATNRAPSLMDKIMNDLANN